MNLFDISYNNNEDYNNNNTNYVYFTFPNIVPNTIPNIVPNTNNSSFFNIDFNIADISNLENVDQEYTIDTSNNFQSQLSQEFYNSIINNLNNIISQENNDISRSFTSLFSSILENLNYSYEYNSSNESLRNFINSTFDSETKKYKRVISDNNLSNLTISKFQKKEAEKNNTNTECPITFSTFEENEEVITLPCNHNFEPESIIKWLTEESNTCPICRHEFDYKEILNKDYQETQETQEHEETEETNRRTPELASLERPRRYLIHDFESNYDEELFQHELLIQQQLLNSFSNNNNNNN